LAPLLVVHDPWQHLLLIIGEFLAVFVFDQLTLLRWLQIRWLRQVRRRVITSREGSFSYLGPSFVFNVISYIVYANTTYRQQYGYAVGWFGIVCAVDLFTARFSVSDWRDGMAPKPLPPASQADLVIVQIVFDVITFGLVAGTAMVADQVIVLA
jgi:hypothetical protein